MSTSRPSRFVPLLVVTCLGLVALDVALVLRNRQLGARLVELERVVMAAERRPLVPGERLPAVTLLDPHGDLVPSVDAASSLGTLFLISSPACDACAEVEELWRLTSATAREGGLRVLGLVLDATPASLTGREASFPLVAAGDDVWGLVERLPGIPAAVLVDASGTVQRSFYGVDQSGLPAAVEAFLAGR